MNFEFFMEPSPSYRAAREAGSVVVQRRSAEMLRNMATTADRALGVNGALVAWMAAHPVDFVEVDEMADDEWKAFIDRRASGREWSRWFGRNSGHRYSIVVYS